MYFSYIGQESKYLQQATFDDFHYSFLVKVRSWLKQFYIVLDNICLNNLSVFLADFKANLSWNQPSILVQFLKKDEEKCFGITFYGA